MIDGMRYVYGWHGMDGVFGFRFEIPDLVEDSAHRGILFGSAGSLDRGGL